MFLCSYYLYSRLISRLFTSDPASDVSLTRTLGISHEHQASTRAHGRDELCLPCRGFHRERNVQPCQIIGTVSASTGNRCNHGFSRQRLVRVRPSHADIEKEKPSNPNRSGRGRKSQSPSIRIHGRTSSGLCPTCRNSEVNTVVLSPWPQHPITLWPSRFWSSSSLLKRSAFSLLSMCRPDEARPKHGHLLVLFTCSA